MNYRTCFGCAVDKTKCTRRAEIKKGLAGLGITSARFKCSKRKPVFRVGQRVRISTRIGGDWDGETIEFHATIISEKGGRFIVKVDDGPSLDFDECVSPVCFENHSGYLKLPIHKISGIDEPDRRVCPVCDAQVDFDDGCYSSGFFNQPDCLRRSDQ